MLCTNAWGQVVRFVDDDAPPGGDGTTWNTAYLYLQDALLEPGEFDQIWVAHGSYKPDQSEHRHVTPGDREASFTMLNGVVIYGGFVGNENFDEFDLANRDLETNEPILTGDLLGNDNNSLLYDEPTRQDNSYHVVVGVNNGSLDGFTIIGGHASEGDVNRRGAGIFCSSSSPTIENNTITGHFASFGGGIYCGDESSPLIVNNTITGNMAPGGSGIGCWDSSPTIAHNTITNNITYYGGGGIHCYDSSPMIANNTITGNYAERGGGVCCGGEVGSSPTIVNNTIAGNRAYEGGGICSYGSSPIIANNTISGNYSNEGGGIYCEASTLTIANNTIVGNIARGEGGGICCVQSFPTTITSTIVAFNSSGIDNYYPDWDSPLLRYNCVYGNSTYDYQGMTDPTGTDGNISADPLFALLPDDGGDGWADDPGTPDVDEGANDDYGDLRLQAGSPCIDAGDNDAVPADTFDLDGDGDVTEPLPFDLAGRPRFVDDPDTADPGNGTPPIVDMGAYENQAEVMLVAAASRRRHGGFGACDLAVPLDGELIEPRLDGTRPQMVLTYDRPAVDPGCGGIHATNAVCLDTSVSGNDLVIDLMFDRNACVEMTVGSDTVRVVMHEGNVSQDGEANLVDLQDLKNRMFQAFNCVIAKYDINCDSQINVIDLQVAKNNVFTTTAGD